MAQAHLKRGTSLIASTTCRTRFALFTLRLLRKVVNKIKRKICYWAVPRLLRRLNNKEKKNVCLIIFARVSTVPFETFVPRHCLLCDFCRSIRKLRISVCDTCVCPFLSHPFESVCGHFVPFSLLSIHFTQSLS